MKKIFNGYKLSSVLIFFSLFAIAAIVFCYWYFDLKDSLFVGALGSMIATILAALLVFILARSGVSLQDALQQEDAVRMMAVDPVHDEVSWGKIIDSSTNLDIVVAYYNKWVEQYAEQLTVLFARGGRVRIVMPDPNRAELLEILSSTFFLDHKPECIQQRILETVKILKSLKERSKSPSARIEVYYLPRPPLYSMIISDEQHLYLSTFEQFRNKGVQASVFDLRLKASTKLGAYWLGRRNFFLEEATLMVSG